MLKILIGLALVFGMGGCLGSKMATPEVDIVKVPIVRTVTEPALPAVEVDVVPQACLDALKYAQVMADASDSMYSRGRRQLELISMARTAFTTGQSVTDIARKQRVLSGTLVGDLSDMAEAQNNFDTNYKKCEAAK